ncbi:MAG TPA: methyltransferase domain-containing protein [Gemmatimonadales bacterium]
MDFRSVYAEHYQRAETSGEVYDRTVGNRFELAIYRLEQELLREVFKRRFHSDRRTRYLDFACGTGRILAVFRDLVDSRVGIDTSAGQLEIARRKDPEAQLLCGNVVTEPELLACRAFDLITCFRLVVNLEPEYRLPILRRLRALLAPSGRLVIDNHMNRYSVLGLGAMFAHRILRMPRKPFVPPGRRGIISTLSEGELRRILVAAGFEVEQVFRIFVLPGHGSLTLLPGRWLVPVERGLSRVPLLNRLSKNQIYVCRPGRQLPA